VIEPARHPLFPRSKAGPLDDACSGFTRVADRAVDPAPLRTRPLDHARGLHYRGSKHLPGPDSHRQAALNLSLLRHAVLLFLTAPEQSRRTRSKRKPGGFAFGIGQSVKSTFLVVIAKARGFDRAPPRKESA
jgi:hypothetical protein